MKRNVIIKLFIDITMLILYALLMFAQGLGGFFHETVGIGIGILFVIHVLFNNSMIKGLLRSVKNGKPKNIALFVSDIVLTICMPIVIISGILIAKDLFAVHAGISWMLLFRIHKLLSFVCLGIMVLHILLHARYLFGVIKKIPASIAEKEMLPAVSRFLAGAAVAAILYSSLAIYKNNFNDPKDHDAALPSTDEASESNDEDKKTSVAENSGAEFSNAIDNTSSPPPTLKEYLSKLRCTGCGKRCFLLNPRCGKGEIQASRAEEEYNRLYID